MSPASEKAARIERGKQILRREGLADACFMLVASGFRPGTTLDDYARILGVGQLDLQKARDRRRGWVNGQPKPGPRRAPDDDSPKRRSRNETPGEFRCGEPGCDAVYPFLRGLRVHERSAHAPLIDCPNGCGRQINQVGLGRHLSKCPGEAS